MKSGEYRPVVRKFKVNDKTDHLNVAEKMASLAKQPRPFFVLSLDGKVLDCGRSARDCKNSPKSVANVSMTFKQWQLATEVAYTKSMEEESNGN